MELTYEALRAENTILRAENAELRLLIKQLQAKISELESQINKNSKNSSKSSSTDQKSNLPKQDRKESRPFHKGTSRQILPEDMVTSQTVRRIDICPSCSGEMLETGEVIKWQQIELPEIKPLIHQWELQVCQCSKCQLIVTPELALTEKYLLGPRFEALVNLCLSRFRMGHMVVREFIATLIPAVILSQGLISKIKRRAAEALKSSQQKIMEKILKEEDALHIDATGWRHQGINEHAVVMRVNNWILFTFVSHQNKATFKELLPKRVFLLVTDRGLAISEIEARIHQYCLAHLLRNIQGLAEHSATSLEETQHLGEIHEAIQTLFIDKHRLERSEISINTWRQYGYQTWRFIKELVDKILENPTSKVGRFCRKLLRGWKHFKTYLQHPLYPMTNNPAEEALRSLVIARKICFGTKSNYGKAWRAAIQSCIETLHRQKRSILNFLGEAIYAFRYRQPTPDICSL